MNDSADHEEDDVADLEHDEEVRWMKLRGKKVIALGERDSVPGEAIAEVARSAGADVIEVRTECFV
jgi:glycine reductase